MKFEWEQIYCDETNGDYTPRAKVLGVWLNLSCNETEFK